MNNKAIIEFGFLDLQNSSYPDQPHSMIAKYQSVCVTPFDRFISDEKTKDKKHGRSSD